MENKPRVTTHNYYNNLDNYVIVNIWTSQKNKRVPGINVGHVSLQTNTHYMSFWPAPREEIVSRNQLNFFHKVHRTIHNLFEVSNSDFKHDYLEDCLCEALTEGQYEEIPHVIYCRKNEYPFLLNSKELTFTRLSSQPPVLKKDEMILAIKPCFANIQIKLYHLNKDRIEAEFQKLKNGLKGWKLTGSNIFTQIEQLSVENCSSLAYRLLKAGGMYEEINHSKSSDGSSIVTPDHLAKHVLSYKLKEMQEYPDTQIWDESNQEALDDLMEAYDLNKNIKQKCIIS